MKKKIIIILLPLILFSVITISADESFGKGSFTFGLGGYFKYDAQNFASFNDTTQLILRLAPEVGYFLSDKMVLKTSPVFYMLTQDGFSPYVYFGLDLELNLFLPFGNIGFLYYGTGLTYFTTSSEEEVGLKMFVPIGFDFLLSNNLALFIESNIVFNMGDLSDLDTDYWDLSTTISFGFHYYIPAMGFLFTNR